MYETALFSQKSIRMMERLRSLLVALININENPTAVRARYTATAPLGTFLVKLGIRPTALNFVGLFTGLLSAVWIGRGEFSLAAIAFLFAGLADSLDGVVARALKVESDFGTFLDSVLDRYVDTAVLLGLAWYFMSRDMPLYVLLTFATVVGTVVTSYSRARAQSLALSSRYIGFMNRPERTMLLIVGLFFPSTLLVISWVLAVLSNLTAIHRIIFFSADAHRRASEIESD